MDIRFLYDIRDGLPTRDIYGAIPFRWSYPQGDGPTFVGGQAVPPWITLFLLIYKARITNEMVDTTDLSPLFARYEGGKALTYNPAVMLKVIVYAYSRKVRQWPA
jgi:hypothetical protein